MSERTSPSWPLSRCLSFRVAASKTRASPSRDPTASHLPSRDQATACTEADIPLRLTSSFGVGPLKSQILTSPASSGLARPPAPLISFLPSGENATDQTRSVWPVSSALGLRPLTVYTRMFLSRQPTARVCPSGETAT